MSVGWQSALMLSFCLILKYLVHFSLFTSNLFWISRFLLDWVHESGERSTLSFHLGIICHFITRCLQLWQFLLFIQPNRVINFPFYESIWLWHDWIFSDSRLFLLFILLLVYSSQSKLFKCSILLLTFEVSSLCVWFGIKHIVIGNIVASKWNLFWFATFCWICLTQYIAHMS